MAFCAACAHFEPNISPEAGAGYRSSAILYGRFYLKTYPRAIQATSKLPSGFAGDVDTQKPTYICFDESQPLRVIQVKPGHYQIAGYLATNRACLPRERFRPPVFDPDWPGRFYIYPVACGSSRLTNISGRFAAEATLDGTFPMLADLRGITYRFTAASVEYREKISEASDRASSFTICSAKSRSVKNHGSGQRTR